ncbi:Arylsulfatase regulator (Fe-S oxidoreductase) [Shigella dysenteriae 1617]|uniref:Arylsulfatase regulator (Fe-S oxidoreductase) n=3 Tax=Shigella dysenteriae TaxID=622 RepID=A0A0A7A1R7_SHIDY|nr:Arylsulfatase regulator (Fe-S oxidoreductase) [Shigella dysenteriae 1617]
MKAISSDQLFNARLTGLISVSELKNAVAVTAAKSVMAFRVLTMAVDLCRLTTRTMNVNAGHERTSKARIIHQIQLIRGITDFLCDAGVEFIQFIPVVERLADETTAREGLKLHAPGDIQGELTEWSVRPEEFGEFLVAIFDHWIKRDVGKIFVMNIEWAFANFVGAPGAVCHHQPTCGRSVIVEHNGDVYACDHYVYPQYRLGNMHQQTIAEMVDSPQQQAFGEDKFKQLPAQCRSCNVLKACWGGCPKHRFMLDASGKPGLNYLCAGYQRYFRHLPPYLKAMADLLAHGRPASDIMHAHLLVVSK